MSAVLAPVPGSQERAGWTSVRRATSLALWQAAPWVLLVLVVTDALSLGAMAWSTSSAARSGTDDVVRTNAGIAPLVMLLVLVATLFSWSRTVRTTVPVLVAGGTTRRAAAGGLLVGAVALAAATDALIAAVAVGGAALQRAIVVRSVPTVPSSGSDAHTPSLTIGYYDPVYDPVAVLPWFVMAALGGLLVGAAWYRWRALGALGTALALLAALTAYHLFVAAAVMSTSSGLVDAAGSLPLVEVGPCLGLVAAVWLVLRRAPLRPVAR